MIAMAMERIKTDDTNRRVELSKLKEDVLEAQKQVGEHRRRVQYHFGQLPTEIVAEIFHVLISEDQAKLLTLLHVCKRWRDIVWHTPPLWDTLTITHRHPTQKVALWVRRSNGKIRELQVRADVRRNLDWSFNSLRGLQWDRLRVCKIEVWDLAQYLESISMSHIISTLEDLQIDDTSNPYSDRGRYFCDKHSLKALTMKHCSFSWDLLSTSVENLTYLAAHNCQGGTGMFHALEANPNLEHLIIESCYISSPPTVSSDRTSLPLSKLSHLQVEGAGASVILERLSFQHLQVLCVRRATGSLDRGLDDVKGRGLTNLTELCVSRCAVTPSILLSLLRHTLLLEKLELSYLSNTVNQVIDAMTSLFPISSTSGLALENSGGIQVTTMCPSLAHLNISYSPDIKTGPLVRLIRSRLPNAEGTSCDVNTHSITKLDSLTVDGCPLIDPDWLPWFRKHVQAFSCVFLTKKNAAWKR